MLQPAANPRSLLHDPVLCNVLHGHRCAGACLLGPPHKGPQLAGEQAAPSAASAQEKNTRLGVEARMHGVGGATGGDSVLAKYPAKASLTHKHQSSSVPDEVNESSPHDIAMMAGHAPHVARGVQPWPDTLLGHRHPSQQWLTHTHPQGEAGPLAGPDPWWARQCAQSTTPQVPPR
jgi:hypothetical protein